MKRKVALETHQGAFIVSYQTVDPVHFDTKLVTCTVLDTGEEASRAALLYLDTGEVTYGVGVPTA